MNKLLIFVIAAAAISITFFVFYSNQIQDAPVEKEIIDQESFTKFISIGTIESDASSIIPRFQPTIGYLAEKLDEGFGGKVLLANDFDSMSQLLKNQELDLLIDSPLTTCHLYEEGQIVPFLVRWKQGVSEYHSVFLVKSDSAINKIDDKLNGKKISLESPTSTTSYLLPKLYLEQKGLTLSPILDNKSVNLVLTGSDITTAHWIINKKTDIGAMSNLDYEELPESMKKELKVIEKTFDVPRHIVSHRSEMDSNQVQKIQVILLDMDNEPKGIEILKNFKNTAKYSILPDKERFCENLNQKIMQDDL